jgi:hypothetical protein
MTATTLTPIYAGRMVRTYRLERPARRANPLRQLQRFIVRRRAR